jgi:hypothetical protein
MKKHPTPQTISRKVRKLLTEAGIKITSTDHYPAEGSWFYGETKLFAMRAFVRKVKDESPELEIHLGLKRSFDRWANSRNFQINIWWHHMDRSTIVPTLKQANSIVKHSGINWNGYFHTIELDSKYV